MRLKQKFAAALAMLLIVLNGFSAFAISGQIPQAETNANRDTPPGASLTNPLPGLSAVVPTPTLSADLMSEGDQPGLYITLHQLPEETGRIVLRYSFNGSDYYIQPDWEWIAEVPEALVGSVTLFVCGLEEFPVQGYLSGQVENLFLQAEIYSYGDLFNPTVADPFRFSHNRSYEIPQTPPPFSVDVKFGWWTYSLCGRFSDFPPNVDKVLVNYSWDGVNYQSVNPYGESKWYLQNLGHPDPENRNKLEYQEIGTYLAEPLKSFLAFEQDSFYIKLEIHTLDGQRYYSQAAKYIREGRQPIPAHLTPRVALGFNVAVQEARYEDGNYPIPTLYTHGQYQVTVPENATAREIAAVLPDTLPVRVMLWDRNSREKYGYADIECPVSWNPIPNLSLTAGKPTTLENAAKPLVLPAGTDIETLLGTYTLQKPLAFRSLYDSDAIQLVLNPVEADAPPEILLRACNPSLFVDGETGYHQPEGDVDVYISELTPLSVFLQQKPTGATAIQVYAVAGEERVDLGNLLNRKPANYNQSRKEYGDIEVLQPEDYPYSDYLAGELDGFTIELHVEGGVFDGKTASAYWPSAYTLPTILPTEGGNAGNENNAGSGYEDVEEDDNGGQRPELPDGGSPPAKPNQPDNGDHIPPTSQAPVTQAPTSGSAPITEPGSAPAAPTTPDHVDAATDAPALIVPDQEQTLPAWSNTEPDRPAAPLPDPAVGLTVVAASLILGGGIAVAVLGGSGTTATVTVKKLHSLFKKLFNHL